MPGARDRFERVLDRSLTYELCLLARGDRVPTFTEKLARLVASATGRSQRDLRVDAERQALFLRPKRYFSLQYLRPVGDTSRYIPRPSE
jgi:hypothetical protein